MSSENPWRPGQPDYDLYWARQRELAAIAKRSRDVKPIVSACGQYRVRPLFDGVPAVRHTECVIERLDNRGEFELFSRNATISDCRRLGIPDSQELRSMLAVVAM